MVNVTRCPALTWLGEADLVKTRSAAGGAGAVMQLRGYLAVAVAVRTSPFARCTVQVKSCVLGTLRTVKATSVTPGRKTVGCPRLIGAGATWLRRPIGMITSSSLPF